MNISEVAEASGLPSKTIRYYEDINLINPGRSANGYRVFRPSDVHKLMFLARSRSLGFSIEDCRALLGLWEDQDRASGDVRKLAKEHLLRIETKIRDLEAIRETLSKLVEACSGDQRPDCPIIQELSAP